MFDRNEFLERIKTEITEPMLEYMEEAEIDDFNGEDAWRDDLDPVPVYGQEHSSG